MYYIAICSYLVHFSFLKFAFLLLLLRWWRRNTWPHIIWCVPSLCIRLFAFSCLFTKIYFFFPLLYCYVLLLFNLFHLYETFYLVSFMFFSYQFFSRYLFQIYFVFCLSFWSQQNIGYIKYITIIVIIIVIMVLHIFIWYLIAVEDFL